MGSNSQYQIIRQYLRSSLGMICILALLVFASTSHAEVLKKGETAVLNMENTDIRTLIATVADKTGKNFIVDPRVKGKVTVISHRPVDRDELYQIFLSILEVHGFAAIPGSNAIKIVPDNTAKQSSIPTATRNSPGEGDEIVTRVYHVEYVNAMQMVPILRPLIPQQGHLAAYVSSNVLIISDRAENVNRIISIVRRIDQPSNDQIEIIPLHHASAAELVRIINTLNQQSDSAKPGAQTKPIVVADERTNSILLGGDKASRLRLRAIIGHLDTPTEASGNTQVVYLRYADATDLVTVLTNVSTGLSKDAKKSGTTSTSAAGGNSQLNIQADENTNALVITAPPELMRSLLAVIKQLDVRRAQVLVEAVIAEVSSTKVQELGIQFRGAQSGNFGATNFSSVGDTINGVSATPSSIGNGLSLGTFTGSTSIFGGTVNLGVLLRALGTDDNTNVLSTPSLLTLDNQEAEIVVGQNVPFVTGTQQTTGGLANPFQTIQRQDVGLTLKVKPQINEGNTIKLDIEQETSSVSNDTSAADIITNKRSIKTTVLVDDANIVVLGGLISENLVEGVQKVPFLGDLPLLGNLFKNSRGQKVKTNLMVFLRPVIVRDAATNTAHAKEKYEYIRGEQTKVKQRGVVQLPDKEAPQLPTLDKFLELPPPFDESPKGKTAPTSTPTDKP